MLVDDERVIREGVRAIIERGCPFPVAVACAASGVEALGRMDEDAPDALIVDINMPEMDGFQFMDAARERGFRGEFVMLTGYDEFGYAVEALKRRALDYLIKPLDEAQLLALLARLNDQIAPPRRLSAKAASNLSPNMARALAYMQEAYATIQSVNDVAAKVFLHPNYLSALFRKELGASFTQYLNRLRVEKAMQLMRDNEQATVEWVSYVTGFHTERNFYKVFKQICGISPGRYHDQVKGGGGA